MAQSILWYGIGCKIQMQISFTPLVILIASVLFWNPSTGQTTNPTEVQYLLTLKDELKLSNEQFYAIDSIYFAASEQIRLIDKEIQNISRSTMDSEQRTGRIRDFNGTKKTIRESRDLSLQLLLTEDQKRIFAERIKPSTPNVIHMGMNHDRMNCNVCIPTK